MSRPVATIDSATRHRILEALSNFMRNPDRVLAAVERHSSKGRPVVIDANRLRGEINRRARTGDDTALVTLAKAGFLKLFAASHVFEEIDQHLDRWALESNIPTLAYRQAWQEVEALLIEVSFLEELLTPDELGRINQLATPPPLGDPDDVPSVIAAMILQAPFLSADKKALQAVYGPAVDVQAQDRYIDALFGAGHVLALSYWGHLTLVAVRLLGQLGRGALQRLGYLPLSLGTVSAAAWALSTGLPGRGQRPANLVSPAIAAARDVLAIYFEAVASYDQLQPSVVRDLGALPRRVRIERARAREEALDQTRVPI